MSTSEGRCDCQEWPNVVLWTKGLRYRPNRIQCRESRGIVGYINVSSVLSSEQFRGKGLRDPGHGRFQDTCAIGREKTKETLKTVLMTVIN